LLVSPTMVFPFAALSLIANRVTQSTPTTRHRKSPQNLNTWQFFAPSRATLRTETIPLGPPVC
jgi:hypothetical protein